MSVYFSIQVPIKVQLVQITEVQNKVIKVQSTAVEVNKKLYINAPKEIRNR